MYRYRYTYIYIHGYVEDKVGTLRSSRVIYLVLVGNYKLNKMLPDVEQCFPI